MDTRAAECWAGQTGTDNGRCIVLVFEHDVALEDAIGSHACSLLASNLRSNSVPLGFHSLTITWILSKH
jgi:hypothetical protein